MIEKEKAGILLINYMRELLYILLITPMLFLAGCETIRNVVDSTTEIVEKNPLIAKTAIQYGTLKYIDGDPEKSIAVLQFVSGSREFLDSSATTRVDEISNNLKEQIDWSKLSPANARIINTLFDTVQKYVTRQVEGENLSAESLVTLNSVLSWIEDAALLAQLGVKAPE